MPAVSRPSLTQYIDDAMRRTRLDAVKIERATGVPASWTRQLKAGRMGGNADATRVHAVAETLHLDEAELWAYLGRMDLVAQLRQGSPRKEPGEDAGLLAAMTAALLAQAEALTDLRAELRETRDDAHAEREAMTRMLARLEARLSELQPHAGTAAAAAAPDRDRP